MPKMINKERRDPPTRARTISQSAYLRSAKPARFLPKCPTGIEGLDRILRGGIPRGCPTLLCGSPGSGKTVLASDFIMRGISFAAIALSLSDCESS